MKVSIYDLKVSEKRIPYLKEIAETEETDEQVYTTPEKVVETAQRIIRNYFDVKGLPEEFVWMGAFDTRLHLTGIFEIAHGSMDTCQISIAGILQRALLSGARQIMLIHNHPSGDFEPSKYDSMFTEKIKKACKVCDIGLMDHIILPGAGKTEGYYSYLQNGML